MGGRRSGDLHPTPRRASLPKTRRPFSIRAATLFLVLATAFGLLSALAIIQGADQTAEAALLAQVRKLVASDAGQNDSFGFDVAVSGDTAVIGARFVGPSSGAVYVFERDEGGANNWGEAEKLTASDAQTGDLFGTSVAISGDTILVGADSEDDGGSNAGTAYVFERDQGGADNWGEVAKLLASDAAVDEQFGHAVAVDGDTAIVSAWNWDPGSGRAGAAYVFERDQGGADNWGEVMKLTASDAQADIFFGEDVAISGDRALIAAPGAAAAYIYVRDQGGADNWGETKKLLASGGIVGDGFGKSVGIDADIIVIGAYLDDTGGLGAGAAYILKRDEGGADNWGEVKKLFASDPEADDLFGFTAAVDTGIVVIGAFFENAGGSSAGAAYVFGQDQGGVGNWGESKKLTASDAQAGDIFGERVAFNGDTAFVAARKEDQEAINAGAVYVFVDPLTLPTPTPCPTEGCPPTATATITPTPTKTPTPTPTKTPTPTITPPYHGAAMSLKVNGQASFKVNVEPNDTFTVTVHADTIPFATGYIGTQAWVDFGNTGLFPLGNQQVIWPDCYQNTFLSGSIGSAENAGCLTALFGEFPTSSYIGAIFSFDVSCYFTGQHTIQLLSYADPVASTSGAGYFLTGFDELPAEHPGDYIADEINVNCAHANPPPPTDLDGDGCSDSAEQQVAPGSETTGGLRDYLDYWDFYDVAIAGAVKGKDLQVDLFNDIVGVIDHYAPTGLEAEYDKWYDRGPNAGPNAWNMTAPDGMIDLFNDIVGVIAQFGHDCR